MSFQFELVGDGSPAVYETPTLFKKDSTGKTRTWKMQIDDTGCYRTLSGLKGGKQAESGWTTPVPASQPTVKEQGEFEVRAQVKHQLDREYRLTEDALASVNAEFVQPMLAKTYGEWPGPGFAQFKLDGIRCLMTAAGMFSRQGQPIVAVPHLHAELAPLFAERPDLILDGEIYSHDLKEDFGEISSIVRKKNPSAADFEKAERVMQYHVYDHVDTDDPFSARAADIRRLLAPFAGGSIQIVETTPISSREQFDELYGEYVEAGYEGGMYRLDKPYELGKRSKALLKRKDFVTEEFKVKSIHEGVGNWAGAAKRVTLVNDQAPGEFGAGIRGSYKALAKMLEEYGGGVPTEAVATVRYFMRSPDLVPRFPVVVDFHPNGRQD